MPACRQLPLPAAAAPQAELNSNLHEQVVLLREQKELSEARAEKSGAEVKKLTGKVGRDACCGVWLCVTRGVVGCVEGAGWWGFGHQLAAAACLRRAACGGALPRAVACPTACPWHLPCLRARPPCLLQVKKLERQLAEAERKVVEGEAVRRRLHNTIQELKGNIRVFCRVRPAAEGEGAEAAPGRPVVAYPAAGDLVGRGLELCQPGGGAGKGERDAQAHSFGFDKVFAPGASQVGGRFLACTVLVVVVLPVAAAAPQPKQCCARCRLPARLRAGRGV